VEIAFESAGATLTIMDKTAGIDPLQSLFQLSSSLLVFNSCHRVRYVRSSDTSVIQTNIISFSQQRWLLEKGRDEEAHAVVRFLHSTSWKTDPTGTLEADQAEREFAEMRDVIHAEQQVRSRRISDLWATPAMLRRTMVACGIQMMGQFTGINGLSILYFFFWRNY